MDKMYALAFIDVIHRMEQVFWTYWSYRRPGKTIKYLTDIEIALLRCKASLSTVYVDRAAFVKVLTCDFNRVLLPRKKDSHTTDEEFFEIRDALVRAKADWKDFTSRLTKLFGGLDNLKK